MAVKLYSVHLTMLPVTESRNGLNKKSKRTRIESVSV